MKKLQIINLLIALTLLALEGNSQIATNDFYDDAETFNLDGSTEIRLIKE